MKRLTYGMAAALLGWAYASVAGYVPVGDTGNAWSQKPWCGY